MPHDDFESRLKTSLETVNGHYDEVIAMSQEVINQSFENLFTVYPELAIVRLSSKKLGKLDAKLHPSRILIPDTNGLNTGSVTYQLRFDTGTLTSVPDDDEEEPTTFSLDGWTLAVNVNLALQKFAPPTADEKEDTKIEREEREAFIKGSFAVEGDYTIERLFAKLSDSYWDQFDFQNSTFGIDPKTKKERSYFAWKKENPGMEETLSGLLRKWANKEQKEGRTTMGVKFTLPSQDELTRRDQGLPPTFQPTDMIHQIYPYRNADRNEGKQEVGITELGNRNCFLYCEMVDGNKLPDSLQLGYSGNLTTLASPTTPKIDGTIALSHHMFMKRFVLEQLQVFNQASEVFPLDATFGSNGSITKVSWNYLVGRDLTHGRPEHEVYMFKPDDEKHPKKYSCTKPNYKESQIYKNPNLDNWTQYKSEGSPNVTVNWQAGKGTVTVQGATDYWYTIEGFSSPDVNPKNTIFFLRDTYQIRWKLEIILKSIEEGVMQMEVKGGDNPQAPANLSVVQTKHEALYTKTPDGQMEGIQKGLTDSMSAAFALFTANVKKAFEDTGKFVYPGNGQLSFSNPMFNYNGDVLAEVNYKPIERNQIIDIPKPSNGTLGVLETPPIKPILADIHAKPPLPRLTWGTSIVTAETPSSILVTAQNKSAEPVNLGYVQITFTSGPDGKLFTAKKFEYNDPKKPKKPETPSIPASPSKPQPSDSKKPEESGPAPTKPQAKKPTHAEADKPATVGGDKAKKGASKVTTKPLPEEDPSSGSDWRSRLGLSSEDTTGTVTVSVAPVDFVKLKTVVKPSSKGTWNIVTQSVKGFLIIPPEGSITWRLSAPTGKAGTYSLPAYEDWKDEEGESDGFFDVALKVELSGSQ